MTLDEITQLPSGARFYRCDLHIHSFGASHDVSDQSMTPEAIVKTAHAEGLAMIAITDHNEILNVQRAVSAASGKTVSVIPGVELSTPEGHLLCYLPDVTTLQQFHGRLSFADRGKADSRCNNAIFECLTICHGLGGFSVLAHVDGAKGYETEVTGAGPHKADVICHGGLLGIELKNPGTDVSYSADDPDVGRRNMGQQRIVRLELGVRQFLARVVNSDAHSLAVMGKNAQGDRKVTRVKLQQPSFQALKLALQDADARVRIEEHIPAAVPHLLGLHLAGGFPADQTIHLSPNLNCIIGGRGAGKSTVFEAIRCLSSDGGQGYMVDKEVWPNSISFYWKDQSSACTALTRALGGEVENVDDPAEGPTAFAIDSFGQGDASRISESAKESPVALMRYLDRFVDFGDSLDAETAIRDALLRSQSEIEKATQQTDLMPTWVQRLKSAETQIATLEQANAKEILGLQRQLAEQKQTRIQLREKLKTLKEQLDSTGIAEEAEALCELGQGDGKSDIAELRNIRAAAATFASELEVSHDALKAKYVQLENVALSNLNAWKGRDTDALAQIEQKRAGLEAQGIKLDMAYIQKLATDEAQAKRNVNTIEGWKKTLTGLKAARVKLQKERWSARNRVAIYRTTLAVSATKTLKATLTDLQVSLKFIQDGYSPDAETLIAQTMGWRTVQVPRANVLVQQLTVPKLLAAIEKGTTAPIKTLQSGGAAVFTESDAQQILQRLGAQDVKFALERVAVEDLPRLTVTRMVTVAGQVPKPHTRDFSQLSLGQQQSVLLALMLSSSSNHPLIIDQPEDNLDSEFIYWTLIPVLRRAKERRQIIIVTHNANIAILSDVEQIIVLKSTSERARIMARGSIDDPATRNAACDILEGAREAFKTRAKIYGIA
jgi:ABC-type lipoprotein export system ATPase subunit